MRKDATAELNKGAQNMYKTDRFDAFKPVDATITEASACVLRRVRRGLKWLVARGGYERWTGTCKE